MASVISDVGTVSLADVRGVRSSVRVDTCTAAAPGAVSSGGIRCMFRLSLLGRSHIFLSGVRQRAVSPGLVAHHDVWDNVWRDDVCEMTSRGSGYDAFFFFFLRDCRPSMAGDAG